MWSLRLPAISTAIRHYGTDLAGGFTQLGVVPEVIDIAPTKSLDIRYCGKKVCGECLTPSLTKCKPKVKWEAEKCTFYTLSMVDPDVPSKEFPKDREFNNWLVVNIPENKISDGCTVVDYIGPLPKKGSGNHRYVFLLYKQKCKGNFHEPAISKKCLFGRNCFHIRNFACKYDLGEPIAGMVFVAAWECYVDQKKKQLKKYSKSKKAKS